jgi:predicted RNA binding protein YcfA (HicA-like mRNA interferase family)
VPRSGEQVLYVQAGWKVLGRRGSHVKVGKGGLRETIPMHRELATGLERKLMKRLTQEGFDSGQRR